MCFPFVCVGNSLHVFQANINFTCILTLFSWNTETIPSSVSSSDSEVVVLLIVYGGILSSENNVIAKSWLDGRMLLRYAHTHPLAPRLWDPLSRRWLDGCVWQRVDIGALGVRVVLCVVLGHWWKCAHVYWKGWEHFL